MHLETYNVHVIKLIQLICILCAKMKLLQFFTIDLDIDHRDSVRKIKIILIYIEFLILQCDK